MNPFLLSDIISCTSYEKLCEKNWNDPSDQIPKSGIVHVPLENIAEFFRRIKGTSENYVLVSSNSDFGLTYQKEYPIWRDLGKWVSLQSGPEEQFKECCLPPRCIVENCDANDKYSIKCHSFTNDTFDEVPSNIISWFCTNAMLRGDDERVRGIPFGVADESERYFVDIFNTEKHNKLYINFENYTFDRFEIKCWCLRNSNEFITLVKEAIPFKEYMEHLQRYAYVVSPYGNGWDCYRTLESIYSGCLPIIERGPLPYHFRGLPIIAVGGIREHLLSVVQNRESIYNRYVGELSKEKINFDKARLSYWRGEIQKGWVNR